MNEGEESNWFWIAETLGMPVAECKARMSSSEFVRWLVHLKRRLMMRTPEQVLLAKIACEVRRSYVKYPARVKLEQFLPGFDGGKVTRQELSPQERLIRSKSAWLGWAGLSSKLKEEQGE